MNMNKIKKNVKLTEGIFPFSFYFVGYFKKGTCHLYMKIEEASKKKRVTLENKMITEK